MMYAKYIDGKLSYAPSVKGNILGYNLETNKKMLLKDGYKPLMPLKHKEKYIDCEGQYSFSYRETEKVIEEYASYHPYDYQQLRRQAYPKPEMLFDALVKIHSKDTTMVKAGEQQLEAYVTTCLQVKAKYPKSK